MYKNKSTNIHEIEQTTKALKNLRIEKVLFFKYTTKSEYDFYSKKRFLKLNRAISMKSKNLKRAKKS
jgi:hypothetical protein